MTRCSVLDRFGDPCLSRRLLETTLALYTSAYFLTLLYDSEKVGAISGFSGTPWLKALLISGAGLSGLIALTGRGARVARMAVWALWLVISNIDPMLGNPTLCYVGWLWLGLSLDNPSSRHLSREFYLAGWSCFGVTYAYSGWTKCVSESWLDGTALDYIYTSCYAYPWMGNVAFTQYTPELCWLVVFLELACFPLLFSSLGRAFALVCMTGLQLGCLMSLQIPDVSVGMLIFHLFLLDKTWANTEFHI